MDRTKRAILVAAMCLLVGGGLALAACGGGDDDDDAGNAATVTQQPQSNGDGGVDATRPADETADAGAPTEAPDDGDGDGGSIAASDPCSVLTQADVEDAFGIPMLDPEHIELPDTPISGGGTASVGSCSYISDVATDSLSVTVYAANENGIEAMIALACQNNEEIPGLGDQACWYSEAHTEIQMKVGSNFIDLFVTTVDGDSAEITTTLAQKAAERLG